MQLVPPTHEQTPIRCSGCHVNFVRFIPAGGALTTIEGYVPGRCVCGYLEEMAALPPGGLFGGDGDPIKRYHPFTRSN